MTGEELRTILIYHNISQKVLAEKLGCTQSSIATRLTRQKVRKDILQAVEQILGRPPRKIIEEPEEYENNMVSPIVETYIKQLQIKDKQLALKDEEINCYKQQLEIYKNNIIKAEKAETININYQEKMK